MSKWDTKFVEKSQVMGDGSRGQGRGPGGRGRESGGQGGDLKEAMDAAREHIKSKQYDESIKAFEKILEENPEAVQAYLGMGNACLRKGEYDKALECFSGALNIKKDFAPAFMVTGNVYLKMEQEDKALENFMAALKLNPDMEQANINIARIHAKQDNLAQAINTLKEALKRNPQSSGLRLTLAGFFQQEGNAEAALKELNNTIAQDPQSWEAYFRLGRLYLGQQKYGDAIDVFKESIKLRPDDSVLTHYALGSAYTAAGQHELALKEFETALKSDMNMVIAKEGIAKIYIEQGKLNDAKKLLIDLSKGKRSLVTVHLLLAEIMMLEKYFDLAIAQYRAAILKGKKLLEKYPELSKIEIVEGDDNKTANAFKAAFDKIKNELDDVS